MHVNVLAYREHVLEPEIQIYWVSSLTVKYGDLFTVSENKKIRFEWQPIRLLRLALFYDTVVFRFKSKYHFPFLNRKFLI